MSPEILIILFVFLLFLLISSIGMSLYLKGRLYDMRSGNYRKFLPAGEQHFDLKEKVQKVRKNNLG